MGAMERIMSLGDGLVSFLSGLGVPGRDKATALQWNYQPLSQYEIMSMFRTDWLSRKIVTIPAKDETREWRAWQAEINDIEALELAEKQLGFQRKVKSARIMARLCGGAGLVMGFDERLGKPEDELDYAKIKKGDLKYLRPLSRYSLTAGPIISSISSPYCGEPEYYQFSVANGQDFEGRYDPIFRIHPSRVVPFTGAELPDVGPWQGVGSNDGFWGDSVLQSIHDALKDATMVNQSIATLVNEAKFDIIKIPELSQAIANKDYERRLTARFQYANTAKSIINTIILDKEEEWQRITQNFGGMPDLIRAYMLIVSGAADIPATRLLGQSPQGFNATGDSDLRNYYDSVRSEQQTELGEWLHRADVALKLHTFGKNDESLHYTWRPLWQLTEEAKIASSKTKADIYKTDVEMGLVDAEALRIGRQNQLIEDGVYPGLETALELLGLDSEESMVPMPTPEQQAAMALAEQQQALGPPGGPPQGGPPKQPITDGFQTRLLRRVKDATEPKPLYVRRDVVNWQAIANHFKRQGLETTVGNEMHVTICYSRAPLDWTKVTEDWGGDKQGRMRIAPGGARVMQFLGQMRDVLVLAFSNSHLIYRHETFKERGASWDWPDYTPHITISLKADPDQDDIEPYRGEIILGPEIFEEIKDDWKSTVTEDGFFWDARDFDEEKYKRDPKGTTTGGQFTAGKATQSVKEAQGRTPGRTGEQVDKQVRFQAEQELAAKGGGDAPEQAEVAGSPEQAASGGAPKQAETSGSGGAPKPEAAKPDGTAETRTPEEVAQSNLENKRLAHKMRYGELKAEWANINNELLPLVNTPDAPEVKAKLERMKNIVKEMSVLDVDTGRFEDVGLPGGPRDVVIIGGGPGGLSAATMGGTEGLDTMLIEAELVAGGQAKYSARIENYPGFPPGVTGEQLTGRMLEQARRTGADVRLGIKVTGMEYDEATGFKHVMLSNGERITSRSVVLAGGLQFRKLPPIPGLEGEGVIYGDGKSLTAYAKGSSAIVIGGSNGAAQAALGAAVECEHVYLMARSPIVDSMSDYQVQQVRNNPKVTVLEKDSVTEIIRDKNGGITGVKTKGGKLLKSKAVGVFIGSVPTTSWLPEKVGRTKHGHIQTERDLETGIPGVYAVGDVREGGMGRIGVAVGEGQIAMRNVFGYFEERKQSKEGKVWDASPARLDFDLIDDLFEADYTEPWFGQTVDGFKPQAFAASTEVSRRRKARDAFDPNQPRDPEGTETGGQFASSGHSATQSKQRAQERARGRTAAEVGKQRASASPGGMVAAPDDRSQWPEHIQGLKVPPAWTNVEYSTDPDTPLQVTGNDAKGRKQYVYSAAFRESQSALKFERIKELEAKFQSIYKQNENNRQSTDEKLREHAEVMKLIMETGLRPGGEGDTRAEKQAYGATTLEGRHVKFSGKRLRFTGKKGVALDLPIENAETASMLSSRAQQAGARGSLFPGVTAGSLLDYVHELNGGGFKTKDFRTYLGTSLAAQLVSKTKTPKDAKSYKKAVRTVAKAVAEKLGNTPAVALSSYISPYVFAPWRRYAG